MRALAVAALAAACCSVAAMPYVELDIVTNDSGAPVRLEYSAALVSTDVTTGICPLAEFRPVARATPFWKSWPASEWRAVDFTFDAQKCAMAFDLAPGFSALVFRNGYCDDHEKRRPDNPSAHPTLDYLAVTRGGKVTQWRGWETAAQFKRDRGNDCILRIR